MGVDPLLPFGELAGGFVRRVASQPETPDIYVNSLLDPGTEEVAAFEGLVGCHGGLGGWQDRACIVVPTELPFPEERVVGADALHVALRDILIHLGHRRDLAGLDAQGNGAETPTLAPHSDGPHWVAGHPCGMRLSARGRDAIGEDQVLGPDNEAGPLGCREKSQLMVDEKSLLGCGAGSARSLRASLRGEHRWPGLARAPGGAR